MIADQPIIRYFEVWDNCEDDGWHELTAEQVEKLKGTEFCRWAKVTFGQDGRPLKVENNFGGLSNHLTYHYDEKGKLLYQTFYFEDDQNVILFHTKKGRDERGRVIWQDAYSNEWIKIESFTHEYLEDDTLIIKKYDAKGKIFKEDIVPKSQYESRDVVIEKVDEGSIKENDRIYINKETGEKYQIRKKPAEDNP
jgi:hypothetical protein